MENCPCGTGKTYDLCCAPFIAGETLPSTPEALMRSRYTAYTKANVDYITRTMKSPAADGFDAVHAKAWAEKVTWLKLEVIETTLENDKGHVEFLAYFYDQKKQAIHELSEFHLIEGAWFYVDGKSPRLRPPIQSRLMGRNESCFCGSGKKYKNCCGE